VIPSFISALLERRAPTIYGDGEQSRDFTYVDNVVEANLLAASSADGIGEIFNIACGEQVSLNQLMVELRRQLDTPIEAEHAPERLGDVRHSHADVSRAEAILGYRPQVAFADGIARTLESWPA
jgi:nucleoside-diphosphate-sugar epimerase